MRIEVYSDHKSIPAGVTFEAPDFCILTGKNGSGKSHLLEAIANPGNARVYINDNQTSKILHIKYNQLNGLGPHMESSCDTSQVSEIIRKTCFDVNILIHQYKQSKKPDVDFKDTMRELHETSGFNQELIPIIKRAMQHSEKPFEELTDNDISGGINFTETTSENLFFTQCAMIFKSYHSRQVWNELNEFRATKYGLDDSEFLSQSDFINKYGPPPWEIINDILSRANLPYEVSIPKISDFEAPYRLSLIDKTNRAHISPSELSSGEMILMSLSLAIFNASEGGNRPDLLLLDEPDAPLHPEFSKFLIDTLEHNIVQEAGIRVILTTHSPATVAMAPEHSVFEINKATRTPFKVSNSQAVHTLTEGVNFLRVSFESKKQIFVESKYDVTYFEKLFKATSQLHNLTFQPVFVEPHSGTSNRTDVISIVEKLRSTGNDLVWGIIDFDNKNQPTGSIIVLGGGNRYAIENYILDPFYICLCLIRHGKKTFADFGINSGRSRYPDIPLITQSECQTMTDTLLTNLNIPLQDLKATKLNNNYEINHPIAFLLNQGHDYETKLNEAYPELREITRGKGDAILKAGVLEVIMDYPQFLPIDVFETFAKILGPKIQP